MARDRREKEELSMVGFHDVFYVPPLLLSFFFPLPSGGTLSFLSSVSLFLFLFRFNNLYPREGKGRGKRLQN